MMRIFVFGSSITSAYWNGAATYYRGIYRNLAELGYEITFAEPDIYDRQANRDVSEIEYANVIVYKTPEHINELISLASTADLVIKHSGIGADDELLERRVLECQSHGRLVAFWDVDAPATLARVESNPHDAFRRQIPQYDFIFTYGGGTPIIEHYLRLGARNCHPIYNALDPDAHFPVTADPAYECEVLFVGNRLPDREARVEQFYLRSAQLLPSARFILGGEGWGGKKLPDNVRWIGHVSTSDHNRLNCSARFVLNVNRESMAGVGFSPPTRVFEAAGAGACVITDHWPGIESFFTPDREILVARTAEDIAGYVARISSDEACRIGEAMRRRALLEHTYALRAQAVDQILSEARRQHHVVPISSNEELPLKRLA